MDIEQVGRIFTFKESSVIIRVSRIKEQPEKITGWVTIEASSKGTTVKLANDVLNLSSLQARNRMAKILTPRYDRIKWDKTLQEISDLILERLLQGTPALEIDTIGEIKPVKYLLYPLIQEEVPTVLYGDGGSLKSTLARIISTCIRLPWTDNPFQFITKDKPLKTLFLDWETNEHTFKRGLQLLKNGMGLPEYSLTYLHCDRPLGEDLENIMQIIIDNDIKFIVVDSLSLALGGDLSKQELAGNIFRDLRQLQITSLLLTHITKSEDKHPTPFGSTFYSNHARSVIYVKKTQEVGGNEISVGLYHKKANETGLFHPIGFRALFDKDKITFSSIDVKSIPELSAGLSLKEQIKELLKSGAMNTLDIAEELGANRESISVILYRNKKMFTRVGKEWGLLSDE